MYRLSPSNTNPLRFEARRCNADNGYGTDTKTYGLGLAPCRPCPANMRLMTITQWGSDGKYTENNIVIAIRASSSSNEALYVDPRACVTMPGFGEWFV